MIDGSDEGYCPCDVIDRSRLVPANHTASLQDREAQPSPGFSDGSGF